MTIFLPIMQIMSLWIASIGGIIYNPWRDSVTTLKDWKIRMKDMPNNSEKNLGGALSIGTITLLRPNMK